MARKLIESFIKRFTIENGIINYGTTNDFPLGSGISHQVVQIELKEELPMTKYPSEALQYVVDEMVRYEIETGMRK